MNAKVIINRTTLNGAKWQIVVDGWGASLYLSNFDKPGYHFSGDIFGTVEEAQAHLDAIDDRVKNPEPFAEHYDIPDDYYGVRGRYYGD